MNRLKVAIAGVAFVCAVIVAAVIGSYAGTTHAQVSPDTAEWQMVPDVPTDVDFRNVFMTSQRSGVAVGKQGDKAALYLLEWVALDGWRNSLKLTPADFIFRAPLWSAVIVNTNIWAVGERGLIVHFDNTKWSEVQSPVPDAQLLTLQMLGNGEEGWAGGFVPGAAGGGQPKPVLLHYRDGRWQRDDSITGDGTINSLHFAQGGGWAVGSAGIWRYRSGTWTKEQEPDPCPGNHCFATYNAVRAISADDAWIAGERDAICGICVPSPYILHRVGGKWQIALDTIVPGDPTREGLGRLLSGMTSTLR